MISLFNVVAFKLLWAAAVLGAARGLMWTGMAALAVIVAWHLSRVGTAAERRRELAFLLAVGLAGALADTGLRALGATNYPTSAATWGWFVVPPWIFALWAGFATLARFSLRWLRGRPLLAVVLGAVGGPLSYYFGTKTGAVAAAPEPAWTYGLLAIEYALAVPVLIFLAPAEGPESGARRSRGR